jgi:hypothetical protein
MAASQMNLHANVAVRLDTPLLSPQQYQPTTAILLRTISILVTTDAFKSASLAFVLAFIMSIFVKTVLGQQSKSRSIRSLVRIITQSISNTVNSVRGRISRALDELSYRRERQLRTGDSTLNHGAGVVPMKFNTSDPITQGWGVCSLASKKKVGRSRYMQYDFSLPQANNTLTLALGQQITLSCLDSDENVARGDFYLFSPRNGKGKFSILIPDSSPVLEVSKSTGGGKIDSQAVANLEYELGKESGHFVSF